MGRKTFRIIRQFLVFGLVFVVVNEAFDSLFTTDTPHSPLQSFVQGIIVCAIIILWQQLEKIYMNRNKENRNDH